jgi:hypothetical protein
MFGFASWIFSTLSRAAMVFLFRLFVCSQLVIMLSSRSAWI